MFKLKLRLKSVCQCAHELKTQAAIRGRIEFLRKTDAVIGDLHHERPIRFRLASDIDPHRQPGGVCILSCIRKQLGDDQTGVERMTRIDITLA